MSIMTQDTGEHLTGTGGHCECAVSSWSVSCSEPLCCLVSHCFPELLTIISMPIPSRSDVLLLERNPIYLELEHTPLLSLMVEVPQRTAR